MREEGPTGSRFCSGDLNLQSSSQKSCRQLITDPVRHVQMKLEPPGTGQQKSEGRKPRTGRSPKSEDKPAHEPFCISGFGFLSVLGLRASGFVPRELDRSQSSAALTHNPPFIRNYALLSIT